MKLIKEIKSKKGEVHFRRWRLFSLPWFSVNIHGIYKHDMDDHLHNHPWNIWTMVLSGGYAEIYWDEKQKVKRYNLRTPLNMSYRGADKFHKIGKILKSPTYTLAIVGKRKKREWGYLMDDGTTTDHKTYRKTKNNKKD